MCFSIFDILKNVGMFHFVFSSPSGEPMNPSAQLSCAVSGGEVYFFDKGGYPTPLKPSRKVTALQADAE